MHDCPNCGFTINDMNKEIDSFMKRTWKICAETHGTL